MSTASPPTLRPLRIGEILDVAIKIYLRNWRTLSALVLVVAVPVRLLGLAVTLSTLPDGAVPSNSVLGGPGVRGTGDVSVAYVTGQFVVAILGGLVALLATAACFKAVSDAYVGERPSWRSSLRFVGRRLHSVVWVTVLYFVGLFLGFLALFVPALWLSIAWIVAVPVLLFEGVKGRRALARSFRLVRKRWWRTFAAVALGYLMVGVVGGLLQAIIVVPIVAGVHSVPAFVVATGLAGVVSSLVTTPFQAAIVTVVYFDLRVRKEGFDLQLLAERLGLPRVEGDLGPAAPLAGAYPAPQRGPGAGDPADGAEAPPYWPPPPGWRDGSGRVTGPGGG